METGEARRVKVFSDFVCPFCYMNWVTMQAASAAGEVAVVWRAFELRPGGVLPPPERAAMIAERWPSVIERGKGFGVDIRSYHFGVDSRPAHLAFKIVQGLAPERADAFGSALYRAYFQDDEDIGDAEVLARLAEEQGLDGAELRARLEAGEALAQVIAEEEEAEALGVSGIPTLIFDDGTRVSGPQTRETLGQLIEQAREGQP